LRFPAALRKEFATEGEGVGADLPSAVQDLMGLAGGIEHALGIGQLDLALARGEWMAANELQGVPIADLERSYPWSASEESGFHLGTETRAAAPESEPEAAGSPPIRRCVLVHRVLQYFEITSSKLLDSGLRA
jgi:hypothetical protein